MHVRDKYEMVERESEEGFETGGRERERYAIERQESGLVERKIDHGGKDKERVEEVCEYTGLGLL